MALEWHKVAIMSSFVAFSRLCVPRQYLIAPRASFQSHPAFYILRSPLCEQALFPGRKEQVFIK